MPRVIQFMHPGGERPAEATGRREWNRGSHSRSFMRVRGELAGGGASPGPRHLALTASGRAFSSVYPIRACSAPRASRRNTTLTRCKNEAAITGIVHDDVRFTALWIPQ